MTEAIFDIGKMRFGDSGMDGFYWPLAREEIITARDRFLNDLVPFLRTEAVSNRSAQVLSLLLPHILGEVLSTFQSQALIRRSRRDGRTPVFSPNARLSNALLVGQIPDLLPTVSLLRRGISPDTAWKPLARAARSALRRDAVGDALILNSDLRNDVITIATGEMILQHAKAVGGVKHLQLGNWFAAPPPAGPGYAGQTVTTFIDTVLDIVRCAFAAGGEPLEDASSRYLRFWIAEGITLASSYLGQLLASPRRVPLRLWRGTGGLVWSRLLSFACQELGGEVTGHDHSHGQGAWASYSDSIIELPFCDRFMVWSQVQQAMAKRNLRVELCLPGRIPEILPVPGEFRPKIPAVSNRKYGAERAGRRKAMYVGTLYVDDFVPFTPLHPAPVLVDWEVRFFRELARLDYDVLFKPHPESRNRIPPATIEKLGVQLINGRFEEVYDQADVLLFGQTNSSTFFGALGTDKSIVLANESLNPWQPEAQNMAEERCVFADTRWGLENRLQTNWKHLKQGLDAAASMRDESFYREFFLL